MKKWISLVAASVLVVSMAACDGDNGKDGDTGLTGTTGAAGATGSTGATGPAGVNGTDGADVAIKPLSVLGQYQSGTFDGSAAEIVTYDPASKRAFVINAASGMVDILDLKRPSLPEKIADINVSLLGGFANSVSVHNGIVAIAVEATVKQDNGFVAFYNTNGVQTNVVGVGALPDALTFSPDGNYVLVANEGEPNGDYSVDPEGSISIIDISTGVANASVTTASFSAFNGRENELRTQGVRIFGPNATAAQDLEPEWVEISSDSTTAYVSLQENNAIAVVNIADANVTNIFPLGFKDWSENGAWSGKGFDASDRDGFINIKHWPVYGMFMPDSIRLYESNGMHYIVTANEGDARDYDTWTEEFRIKDLILDSIAFPNAAELQEDANLGRLRVTSTLGVSNGCEPSNMATDVEADCEYDKLYAYGGRSMSIFRVDANGLTLVYDSGSQMEETTAKMFPNNFNSTNDENNFDNRSDDKGPEPEGVALGKIGDRTYAFVGIERIGGVMMYDITEPANTTFIQYINNRDFTIADPADLITTDSGAEGLHFISAEDSPDANGRPLLIVGNEVSGTTTIFAIDMDNR